MSAQSSWTLRTAIAIFLLLTISVMAGAGPGNAQADVDWQTTGSLTTGRYSHTATLLPSGKVLVAAGYNGGAFDGTLSSAELYDPSTGTWQPTGSLLSRRYRHTATLLPSGKVLVAGGYNDAEQLRSAELYDPSTGTWQSTGDLAISRERHTATLLPSGKVLVAGGNIGAVPLSSAELYDPSTGTWQPTGHLITGRHDHTATLLPSGKVLVAGGGNFGILASAELYDPSTGMWQETGDLGTGRFRHTATFLRSGKVLVAGGGGSGPSAELYDPSTETWQPTGDLATERFGHQATLLPSGKVLIAGWGSEAQFSSFVSSAELYDPSTGTWQPSRNLDPQRIWHTATLLPSGKVLVAGGWNNGSLSGTELYDPSTGTWQAYDSGERSEAHTATLLPSGKVLIAGGFDNGHLSSVRLYDPRTETWQTTGHLATARQFHTATLLPSGEVLVTGGENDRFLSSTELYDLSTEMWRPTSPLFEARTGHTATLLPSGKVLVAGGNDNSGDALMDSLSSAELYDPSTGAWQPTGHLVAARAGHTATLLPSGKVLVTGGEDFGILASAELYDPNTETWQPTGYLTTGIHVHTATLLPSGKVLVVGGRNLSSAELYDPSTGMWQPTDSLATGRHFHTATLLPSGKVLVVGGENEDDGFLSSAELYDPSTGTWQPTGDLTVWRTRHTATLLPSGQVLVVGLDNAFELYFTSAPPDSRRPVVQSTSGVLENGVPFEITGQLRGDSEASDGTTSSSAVSYPLVRLRSLDGSQHVWLVPDDYPDSGPPPWDGNIWDDPMTLTVSDLPPTLLPGPHLLSVVTAGVASEPVPVDVPCNLALTRQPGDQLVALGEQATFEVEAQGSRAFRWEMCHGDPESTCAAPADPADPDDHGGPGWMAIPGANSASYTTAPIQASESGTLYRVLVDGLCHRRTSEAATLKVDDMTSPGGAVVSPDGGELWPLSQPGEPAHTEAISWTMSDDVRVCQVELSLLYSNDGGQTYPPANRMSLRTFGSGGICHHPGVETTSFGYDVPEAPPSGQVGSLYKVEVKVTDHAGNPTVDESDRPFFIVEPNNDSVKTLILWHPERMETLGLATAGLRDALDNLAVHPRVQGRIVDLGASLGLRILYEQWDAGETDANDVLFGTGGVHGYLNDEWLATFTGVEYLVLVGDDRVIPLARLRDGTAAATENVYPDDPSDGGNGDLTADGTRVGESLAANFYLSDDPLATFGTLAPGQLDDDSFLPDLAVGRLVETPGEIVASIATFINKEGVLDLTDRPNKVLVTAYDFLVDSGTKIGNRWKAKLSSGVDSSLVGQGWDVDDLQGLLCPANDPYGVLNLNGHASHYEVGGPSADNDPFDIQGLATDLFAGSCDLSGSVVYAVGCHSGLPVADDSMSGNADHPRDLPQTMLGAGAMAFLGNTGYGWGLRHGVGYSERLVEIFSEELTAGGTVVLGDAVMRTKLRYFLESPRFDAYDEKVSMQWTLYGFPMYALHTGAAARSPERRLFEGAPPRLEDLPGRESFGPVTVDRNSPEKSLEGGVLLTPPDFLTRLDLSFDFRAGGVYKKFNAAGQEVSDTSTADCSAGCYYALNNVSSGQDLHTGATDRPLQPMFIYDSRLSGTSFHGFLWKGGTYVEEENWVPLVATLQSNVDGEFEDRDPLPRVSKSNGRGRARRGATGGTCDASDTDVSSLVLETGELLHDTASSLFTGRRYDTVDVEVLYFNNTDEAGANCDRTPPELSAQHRVTGSTVHWTVGASDPAGVWRVLVVWNDGTVETGAGGQARGRWHSSELELVDDTWQGSLQVVGSSRITYFVQAVDNRGNVSLLSAPEAGPPPSGVPLDFPEVVEVNLAAADADLAAAVTATPNPVAGLQPFAATVSLTNLGPDPAAGVTVSAVLPGATGAVGTGSGWSCETTAETVSCTRNVAEPGTVPPITVFATAPPAGDVPVTVTASTLSHDAVAANDSANVSLSVLAAPQADLVLTQDVSFAADFWSPIVTLTITNDGPDAVGGATVTDIVPGELAGVGWSCTASSGATCTAFGAGDVVDRVTIPAGGWVRYTVSTVLAPGYAGQLRNTATVTVPSGVYDPALGSNSSTVMIDYSGSILTDGFESGDVTMWSSVVGEVP